MIFIANITQELHNKIDKPTVFWNLNLTMTRIIYFEHWDILVSLAKDIHRESKVVCI